MSTAPSTPHPTVAEIARRRRRLGMSRPMLASLASVSQPALARAERGLRELYPSEAERLAAVLDGIEALAHQAVALRAASA
jgi:predicted transcriptional regulator